MIVSYIISRATGYFIIDTKFIIIFGERSSSPRIWNVWNMKEITTITFLPPHKFKHRSLKQVPSSSLFYKTQIRGGARVSIIGARKFRKWKKFNHDLATPIYNLLVIDSQKQECSNSNLELETAQLNHLQHYTAADYDPFLQFERQQVRGIIFPWKRKWITTEYETLSILQRKASRK